MEECSRHWVYNQPLTAGDDTKGDPRGRESDETELERYEGVFLG